VAGGGGGGGGGAAVSRAIAAESAAASLRAENEALQRRLASASSSAGAPAPAPFGTYAGGGGGGTVVSVPRAELMELERALKDKTAQVLLLKSRYEHLEARAGAERELYDRALVVLEEQAAQIRDARGALAAAEGDVATLRARAKNAEDAAAELARAKEEVRRLERALTDLCACFLERALTDLFGGTADPAPSHAPPPPPPQVTPRLCRRGGRRWACASARTPRSAPRRR
jgi:DNA repair exonuclease SbcCD ATPase subunit